MRIFKKLMLLALTLISISAALTGCCLSHKWVDADCVTPKTCAKCGVTEGEALGHTWTDAACETPKTCEKCAATEGEALGHNLQRNAQYRYTEDTFIGEGVCSRCSESMSVAYGEEAEAAKNFLVGEYSAKSFKIQGTVVPYNYNLKTIYGCTPWLIVRDDGTMEMLFPDALTPGGVHETGTWEYVYYEYSEVFGGLVFAYYFKFDTGTYAALLLNGDGILVGLSKTHSLYFY